MPTTETVAAGYGVIFREEFDDWVSALRAAGLDSFAEQHEQTIQSGPDDPIGKLEFGGYGGIGNGTVWTVYDRFVANRKKDE